MFKYFNKNKTLARPANHKPARPEPVDRAVAVQFKFKVMEIKKYFIVYSKFRYYFYKFKHSFS